MLVFFYKLLNCDLVFPNAGILALFVETLEFWSYFSKRWNSCPIVGSIKILISSFQALEFWSYYSTHCNCGFFINTGVLISFFQTLEFWRYFFIHWLLSYPSKHGNCGHIYKGWNSDLYPLKHLNSDAIFVITGIFALSFQTLVFQRYFPWYVYSEVGTQAP